MNYSTLLDVTWLKVVDYPDEVKLHFDFTGFVSVDKETAIDIAAEKIKAYNNVFVSMSGGLDSEFTANSLHKRGIKFTPVLVDYDSNVTELWYAKHWCSQNNILPIIHRVTKEDLIESIESVAKEHKDLPGNFPIYYLRNKLKDSTLIISSADPFRRYPIDSQIDANNSAFEYAIFDFIAGSANNVIQFLYQSRELFVNFIEELDSLALRNSTQAALAKYYGLVPRPKIDFLQNILMHGKTVYDSYVKSCELVPEHVRKYHRFDHKDFINRCYNQEKFYISLKKKSGV